MRNEIGFYKDTQKDYARGVSVQDIPDDLAAVLANGFHADIQDNEKGSRIPYLYVDIPEQVKNPKSLIKKRGHPAKEMVPNMTSARKRMLEQAVKDAGWFILDKFTPGELVDGCYTWVISPYRNPKEEFDDVEDERATARKNRKDTYDSGDTWGTDDDVVASYGSARSGDDDFTRYGQVSESTKVTLSIKQLKQLVNACSTRRR